MRLQIEALATLGRLGVPGLFSRACMEGDCCVSFWDDLQAEMPRGVGHVAVYSRTDGIVSWRACQAPGADLVEVASSHCGMAVHGDVYRVVADSLAAFRRRDARRRPVGRAVTPLRSVA